jgi:hypothetical protein
VAAFWTKVLSGSDLWRYARRHAGGRIKGWELPA